MTARSDVALVLGSGGILGAAFEIGALAALEARYDEGVVRRTFDLYLGTSAGAFVAAVVSQGIPPTRLFEAYRDRDPELLLQPHDVYSFKWKRFLGGGARFFWAVAAETLRAVLRLKKPSFLDVFARGLERLPAGFLSIDRLDGYLCRLFAKNGLSNRFEDLEKTLLIPAVDLDAGITTVFGTDDGPAATICRAVTASSAIPQVFAPVRIGGRYYVDGMVGGATHLEIALERGPERVLFINPVVPSCASNPTTEVCECRFVSQGGLGAVLDQCMKIQHEASVAASVAGARGRFPGTSLTVLEPPRLEMPPHGLMEYDGHLRALMAGRNLLDSLDPAVLRELDALFQGDAPPVPAQGGPSVGASEEARTDERMAVS